MFNNEQRERFGQGKPIFTQLGRSPLHYAAAKDQTQLVKLLLLSGADVNHQTIGGETPLMKAISFNRLDAAKLLLRFGADVYLTNRVMLLLTLGGAECKIPRSKHEKRRLDIISKPLRGNFY